MYVKQLLPMLLCKYQQIADLLASRIMSGALPAYNKVPSEVALSRKFGVARETVRRALDELARRGLIKRKRGIGTFVRPHRNSNELIKVGIIVTDVKYARRFPLIACELLRTAGNEQVELLLENTFNENIQKQLDSITAAFARFKSEGAAGILYQTIPSVKAMRSFERDLINACTAPIVIAGCGFPSDCSNIGMVDVNWAEEGRMIGEYLQRKKVRRAFFVTSSATSPRTAKRIEGMLSVFDRDALFVRTVKLDSSDKPSIELPAVKGMFAIIGDEGCPIKDLLGQADLAKLPRNQRIYIAQFETDSTSDTLRSLCPTTVRGSCVKVMRYGLWHLLHLIRNSPRLPCTTLVSPQLEISHNDYLDL